MGSALCVFANFWLIEVRDRAFRDGMKPGICQPVVLPSPLAASQVINPDDTEMIESPWYMEYQGDHDIPGRIGSRRHDDVRDRMLNENFRAAFREVALIN